MEYDERVMSTALSVPTVSETRRAFLAAPLDGLARQPGGAQDQPPSPLENPRIRIAHLLRRAAFSASKADLDLYEAMGYEAAVDRLLNYDAIEDPIAKRLEALDLDPDDREGARRGWMVRLVHSTRPLQEKMTLFWHGVLTSGFSKVNSAGLMRRQNEFLRANALGDYGALLKGISKDAAMLIWLDGRGSKKQHPNENYARELMELFTIGEGNFTEQDVQEAARAFTGWRVSMEGEVTFSRNAHDNGIKTFMGRSGRFKGDDIIDILLEQRATARFLCRKLFSYFAYRNPEPAVIEALADLCQVTGYNIKALMRTILLSPEFSSRRAYRAIVRGPVDLVVGALRQWGLETDGQFPAGAARAMGQDVFNPPNVAGWPGGPAWLNSANWLQRVNFANGFLARRRGDPGTFIDLTELVQRHGIESTEQLRGFLSQLLVDGVLDPDAEQRLNAYLNSDQPLTLNQRSLNRKGRSLAYFLMAGPAYQVM